MDNDGDGQTDSVWVDLGYPARRNAQGQLYKPLFAFMVIGLNGRIPLNTAGNLAGGRSANSATHAAHLGNSVSEVDPTYGLQNGFVFATDAAAAFTSPSLRLALHREQHAGGQQQSDDSARCPVDPASQSAGRDPPAAKPHGEPFPPGSATRPGRSTATTTSS